MPRGALEGMICRAVRRFAAASWEGHSLTRGFVRASRWLSPDRGAGKEENRGTMRCAELRVVLRNTSASGRFDMWSALSVKHVFKDHRRGAHAPCERSQVRSMFMKPC